MAFQSQLEEFAFVSRVVGVGLIVVSPFMGPLAPACAGIGSAIITGHSVGKICRRIVRGPENYKPSTEERVSSFIAGGANLFHSGYDLFHNGYNIVDKLRHR